MEAVTIKEELIVEIFGNVSLSSAKNSLISWSSTAVSHEAVFFFFHYALSDETETKRKTELSSTFLH